ncbi:MAG: NapC/NirT family cytochrome c [Arcobacter sp.]|nr:NapC/NirT family cytochrome c [Arcobacter sp.]
MKKYIFGIICIGIVIGLALSYTTYFGLKETSGEKFCVICHEMDPMVMAYKEDVHGGKGKLGANARCVDCHLPHDNLVKYIYTKARNGVEEVAIHFFGDLDEIDWLANLKRRDEYVFDNGCMHCHSNILDTTLASSSKQAQKMHKHYQKLKGTSKEIKCASCHFDAGHKNMRSFLNYYKPEFDLYKEKMEKKKKEAIKKYKKYGINTNIE